MSVLRQRSWQHVHRQTLLHTNFFDPIRVLSPVVAAGFSARALTHRYSHTRAWPVLVSQA